MVGDELLRSIWLSRLLISLQLHSVTRTNDHLDQLAYAADIIIDTARTTFLQVAETARPSGIHDAEQDKDWMTALEARVKFLEAGGESGRDNSDAQRHMRSRSRLQPRPRNRGHAASGLCWYHWRFESEVRRCESPCSAQQPAENATAHH